MRICWTSAKACWIPDLSLSEQLQVEREQRVTGRLEHISAALQPTLFREEGSLIRMIGIKLEAVGCQAPIGSRCKIITDEGASMEAEVVGFSDGSLFLMPEGNLRGVRLGARVVPLDSGGVVEVGDGLLGRVIDGAGKPTAGPPSAACITYPCAARPSTRWTARPSMSPWMWGCEPSMPC